jgi:hypothetical protein
LFFVISPPVRRIRQFPILIPPAGLDRQQTFQVSDAFHESQIFDNHHQINGIEVFLAQKTPGKIRFRIGCGLKLSANRTKESEISLADFRRDVQFFPDQHIDRYQIAQSEQFIACEPSLHVILP